MTQDPLTPDQRFSETLVEFARSVQSDRISVGDLMEAMKGRAIAALMFIFAFPNILPTPPGLAAVLGLPLIYLSSQLMLGRQPWLPQFIAGRSMARESFTSVVERAIPMLNRAEKMLTARLPALTSVRMQRVVGGVCLMLALLLSLPIPLGNLMPSAAVSIFALALLERDGLWVILGFAATVAALFWVGSIAYGLILSAMFIVMNAF